jgi:arabinogalactan endo-1,4-beta-galactosidase
MLIQEVVGRCTWPAGGLLLILYSLTSQPLPAAGAPVFTDTFSANRLDRTRWDVTTASGATVFTGAGLNMSFDSSGNSQANLYTFFHLIGDFDVQVDFAIGDGWATPFPAADSDSSPQLNGGGMLVYLDQPNWMSFFRGRFASSQSINFYSNVALNGAATSHNVSTTAMSGSLRIVSSGGVYQFLFDTGNGWTLLTTAPSWSQPVLIGLSGGTVSAHVGFATTLTNFQVNSGITDYEPYQLPAAPIARPGFRIGGTFYMETVRRWMQGVQSFQPMTWLKAQGMGMARACMTTTSDPTLASTPAAQWHNLPWQSSFAASREMVAQTFKDAMQADMRISACFYLSDSSTTSASQQTAPAAWQGLSLADTAAQVEQYTFATTTYLLSQGISPDLYEVGNETLIGLDGFIPGQRIAPPANFSPYLSPSYLTESVWPSEATLFIAAIRGIRGADPKARVALHVEATSAPAMDTVYAFFQQMKALGVTYDVAGLSGQYVNGNDLSQFTAAEYLQRWNTLVNRIASLGKAVAITEFNYPWENATGFSPPVGFYPPMQEYAYTPAGQYAFLKDQLTWASNNANIISWGWFYPEFYAGVNNGQNEAPNDIACGLLSDGQTLLPATAAMNFKNGNTAIPCYFRGCGVGHLFGRALGAW